MFAICAALAGVVAIALAYLLHDDVEYPLPRGFTPITAASPKAELEALPEELRGRLEKLYAAGVLKDERGAVGFVVAMPSTEGRDPTVAAAMRLISQQGQVTTVKHGVMVRDQACSVIEWRTRVASVETRDLGYVLPRGPNSIFVRLSVATDEYDRVLPDFESSLRGLKGTRPARAQFGPATFALIAAAIASLVGKSLGLSRRRRGARDRRSQRDAPHDAATRHRTS